jgi:hypothetical protein
LVLGLMIGFAGCGGGHAGTHDASTGADSTSQAGDGGDAVVVTDATTVDVADTGVDARSDAAAMNRDGAADADDASVDTAPPCSPCNLQLGALVAGCTASTAGVSCVVQTSQTINSDGTTVNVVDQCFANGTKFLTTKISGSVDAGAFVSSISEHIKNGQICLTQQTSGVRSTAGLVATDLFLDGAGQIVATVMTNAVAGADGGVVQIQTVSCSGLPAEPYRVCQPPPADAGDGGSADDAGGSGVPICTPGACS